MDLFYQAWDMSPIAAVLEIKNSAPMAGADALQDCLDSMALIATPIARPMRRQMVPNVNVWLAMCAGEDNVCLIVKLVNIESMVYALSYRTVITGVWCMEPVFAILATKRMRTEAVLADPTSKVLTT